LVDDLDSYDPLDSLQLDPDFPIGGTLAAPMSSPAPEGLFVDKKKQLANGDTRAIKETEPEPRESCCEDEELKGKNKAKGSENQSPGKTSSLSRNP